MSATSTSRVMSHPFILQLLARRGCFSSQCRRYRAVSSSVMLSDGRECDGPGWLQSWLQVVSSHSGVHRLPPSPPRLPHSFCFFAFCTGGLLWGHHPSRRAELRMARFHFSWWRWCPAASGSGSSREIPAERWVPQPHGLAEAPVEAEGARQGQNHCPKGPGALLWSTAASPPQTPGQRHRVWAARGQRAGAKHGQRACKTRTEIRQRAGSAGKSQAGPLGDLGQKPCGTKPGSAGPWARPSRAAWQHRARGCVESPNAARVGSPLAGGVRKLGSEPCTPLPAPLCPPHLCPAPRQGWTLFAQWPELS